MPKFTVRIDACFNFDVEADSAAQARQEAEDHLFQPGEGYDHTTETLVFKEDGVTIADDDDDSRPCECFNCSWKGSEDDLNEIKDFHQRIEPGDTAVPAGECPECGCLAYLKQGDE